MSPSRTASTTPSEAPTTGDRLRQVSVVLVLVGVLVMNYLATALPLAGRDTGEISDSYPTLVTPAGYVFAIWGVIYLALIGYAIYQALPAQASNPHLRSIGWVFALNGGFNVLWLWLWHNLWIGWSLLVMLCLLATLIVIYLRLREASAWLRLPFSIYLGWISIATIANASIFLVDAGWGRFGLPEVTWAVVILSVGALIASIVAWRERDLAYVGVFVWAYLGIAANQADTPAVVRTAYGALVVIVAVWAWRTAVARMGRSSAG
jgi:hypothetical protein